MEKEEGREGENSVSTNDTLPSSSIPKRYLHVHVADLIYPVEVMHPKLMWADITNLEPMV